MYHNKDVEYLDLTSPSGQRTYTRTLFMVLCKAVHDLYPEGNVWIDIPVSNGYYCDLIIGEEVTEQVAARIRQRMQEIIDAKLPLRRHECTTEEAIKVFEGRESKVKLLRSTGSLYTTYYDIDGYKDYYYGSLLTNTSQLKLFGLEKYFDGLLLLGGGLVLLGLCVLGGLMAVELCKLLAQLTVLLAHKIKGLFIRKEEKR